MFILIVASRFNSMFDVPKMICNETRDEHERDALFVQFDGIRNFSEQRRNQFNLLFYVCLMIFPISKNS